MKCSKWEPPLIVAGIVATIVGCLLLGPLAIRVFSRLAGRVSIAPRLALRDLVRYQARSGAALAAVTLALGIAATVVIIASAEAAKKAAEPAKPDRKAWKEIVPQTENTLENASVIGGMLQLTYLKNASNTRGR